MSFMLENFTNTDWLKVIITVVSIISLYLFRRQIQKIVSDIIVGGDTARYNEKSVSDIIKDVEARLDEVVK